MYTDNNRPLGLNILLAPAAEGKTFVLNKLTKELFNGEMILFNHMEPLEPGTLDLPLYPQDLTVIDNWYVISEDLPDYFAIDSIRLALFSLGGTTLKGGFSSDSLLALTSFHNALVLSGRCCFSAINPIYGFDRPEEYNFARAIVSGSVGGLISRVKTSSKTLDNEKTSKLLGLSPRSDGLNRPGWSLDRDRFGNLKPVWAFLNQIHNEGGGMA